MSRHGFSIMDMNFKFFGAAAIAFVLLDQLPADQIALMLIVGYLALRNAGVPYVLNGNPVYG